MINDEHFSKVGSHVIFALFSICLKSLHGTCMICIIREKQQNSIHYAKKEIGFSK